MDRSLLNFLDKYTAPLRRRVMLMIARSVVAAVDDSKKMQLLKIDLLAGETKEGVERFQNYGFTSVPFPEAEALAAFIGGDRSHGVVFCVDDRRYRLKGLEEGEVALYTDEGDKIHIKRGGNIEIVATSKVVVNAPLVDVGDSGLEAVLNGATFQAYFNTHTHVGNAGAPTSPPQVPSGATHLSTKVRAAK